MHEMYELKEMLCDELAKITKKGELSAGSLDAVDKLTHSIKSIDTIIAMDEYSEDDGMMSYDSYDSYARGDGRMTNRGGGNRGNSRENRRRDSMGRYVRDYSNRGSYARRGGYSRDEEMENLKMNLHEMLEDANSEEERKMIRKWIKQVEE
jgi:hypothetical protein